MEKEFELWLDESGTFEDEEKQKRKGYRPSLIGGFLIEQELAETVDYETLIEAGKIHATELSRHEKISYILPILENLQDVYQARQVFFENSEYEDAATNRQLYLKIMAEGLLQLLQLLSAAHEAVVLHVLIAQRQDVTAPEGNQRIREKEYMAALRQCMEQKKRERKIALPEDCELRFEVAAAHRERKLQLADFACNVRLTRDSIIFRGYQDRLHALYVNAYLFSLHEMGSMNFIRLSLARGHIADAIFELYTTTDSMNKKQILDSIIERMKTTSYWLVKAQLAECSAQVVVYAARQDDFEVGESLLKRLLKKVIPCLKEADQPYLQFQTTLLLQLTDMYLQESDLLETKNTLEECRHLLQQAGNRLETFPARLQLMEKEAMLAIKGFDFQTGAKKMEEVCQVFELILHGIIDGAVALGCTSFILSAKYGDALCRLIYAKMLQQRKNPKLYEELCRLSDLSMEQYPQPEAELAGIRQLRSRIEAEAGNFQAALSWLFLAKEFRTGDFSAAEIGLFLDLVCDTESRESCQDYLMYYLLIVTEGKREGHPIADEMFHALSHQKRLLETADIVIENEEEEEFPHEVDMETVKEADSGVEYHPLEIICWKYGAYLAEIGNISGALKYYTRATQICFRNENYETLYVTGFGIEAEKIACLAIGNNTKVAKRMYRKLEDQMDVFLHNPHLKSVLEFVKGLQTTILNCKGKDGRIDWRKLKEASGKLIC